MKRLGLHLIGLLLLGLLLQVSEAHALVCPSPANQPLGTAWCDPTPADPTRYLNDTLCVAEPVAGPSGSSIDEEIMGGGVCVLAKFKTADSVHNVVDFVVSYDFLGTNPLTDPSGLFVPDLGALVGGTDLMTTLPLEQEGLYALSIQGRVLASDGSFQDISLARRVLRVAEPSLTITNARVGGSINDCSATDPSCIGVDEIEGDSDGDGICDGPLPIPGVCSAGPDPTDDKHAVELDPLLVRAGSVDLCVNTSSGSEPPAGNSVIVHAVNTITDSGVTPVKKVTVDANCVASGETYCQPSTDGFCPGGFKISVPLGNGKNDIELFVSNLATGFDAGSGERIKVKEFDADLAGPKLCVNYLNQSGNKIDNADGKAILQTEASSVTVDVTLGTCGGTPETVTATLPDCCDASDPPVCGSSPVCLQSNNEKDGDTAKFVAMSASQVNGQTHYQAQFGELRFPVNTAVIKASDNLGNQTVETHPFGYGNVRPLFNEAGYFDIKKAVVPNGLGGFVNADFVKNELLPVVIKAVNSKKFKNDMFLKLLDPHQPGDEEVACLKSIEEDAGCQFNHIASKDRVVALKLFCDGGDCTNNIGEIQVPSLYFLNQDRIRVQLKIKGLHGRAEMYTMRFIDSDDDSVVDTEDDDADNDGICDRYVTPFGDCTDADADGVCDEEIGLTGSLGKGLNASNKCVLDKSIPKRDCPDVDTGDEEYFGCSDQDDDNDGVPDDHDMPGRLIQDPDFGTYVFPLSMQVKELALNLDVQFLKDANGRLRLQIAAPPGRELVQALAEAGNLITFDCERDVSEIYQGGRAGEEGNGRNLWIDTEACTALGALSNSLNGHGSGVQEVVITLSETIGLVDRMKRQNEGTNQQLLCTLYATARCSIPKRLEATLDKFETDKVLAISAKALDHRFHLDLYAPLGSADVNVDSRGLGFKAGGLLVPAGITDPDDTAERNASDFLNALPDEFKNQKFGPLSPASDVDPVDPIEAAFQMGSETNLAVAEETVNSVLHSAGLLLWDLARKEGENHQSLDFTAKKLREDFDMGIPDIGSSSGCKDKDGNPVAESSYKCFPFPLNIENVLGPTTITYVDFDGDGVPGTDNDKKTPTLLRNNMNPLFPPTARIVSVTPIQTWDGSSSSSRPAIVMMELEIALANAQMSVFEEKVADWNATPIQGTGEIKDWCDVDRYPGANQAKCDGGHKLPMVTFGLSGRVFATVLMSVKDKGIIRLEGGLSSVERAEGSSEGNEMDLDRIKTQLEFTVLENNTIVPDNEIAAAMKGQVDLILPKYVFGNARDIRLNIPAQLPLEAYCSIYQEASPDLCACVADPAKDDCDLAHSVQNLWRQLDVGQFGIEGVRLDQTLLGVTADDMGPRYMTIGVESTIELKD